LKSYHVKLNFETINLESSFITRYNDIAGCCFLLLGHPDIQVICLAYEIMVGVSTNIIKINSIRNYPNDKYVFFFIIIIHYYNYYNLLIIYIYIFLIILNKNSLLNVLEYYPAFLIKN